MMLEGIATKAAGILTAGAIQASGRKLRNALATPDKEKAVKCCAQAGLEALLEKGTPEDEDTRRHVASVMETFFGYPRPQTVVADNLRGRDVSPADMAELFTEECPGLEGFNPQAGFEAFLEALERRLDHEPQLRVALRIGLERRQTKAQEDLVQAVKDQPRAQREARKKDRAEQAQSARHAYLDRMRELWSALPLAPLGGRSGQEEDVTLDQVYIYRSGHDDEDREGRRAGSRTSAATIG